MRLPLHQEERRTDSGRVQAEDERDCVYGGSGMSLENVFPFLGEEREREIKRELDLLRGLLAVMERDEKKVSGE